MQLGDNFICVFEFSAMSIFSQSVERKFAQFGEVRVYWQVVRKFPNGSVTGLSSGQEFTIVADFVTFTNGLSSQSITLTSVQDGVAELDESFELHLINATGKNYLFSSWYNVVEVLMYLFE